MYIWKVSHPLPYLWYLCFFCSSTPQIILNLLVWSLFPPFLSCLFCCSVHSCSFFSYISLLVLPLSPLHLPLIFSISSPLPLSFPLSSPILISSPFSILTVRHYYHPLLCSYIFPLSSPLHFHYTLFYPSLYHLHLLFPFLSFSTLASSQVALCLTWHLMFERLLLWKLTCGFSTVESRGMGYWAVQWIFPSLWQSKL